MDIPGLPARRAALRLLDAVLRRGETLDQAVHNAVQGLAADADRALARAIAAEALRWLPDLDALIDSATPQVLPDDAKPRAVLRLMLAQWLRLGTPPHAVVATALPLLTGGPKRLAHGVFATLTRRQVALPVHPGLPPAVAARWGDRAGAIAAALGEPPLLDLTLRDPAATADWAERLGGVSLLPGHVRLPRGEAIERLPGFAEGAWWVQDLAASLPARLLGLPGGWPGGAGRALDLCAAPGGKALQLAAMGWQVTALDSSAKRLERMAANFTRCALTAEVVTADLRAWEPDGRYDAILLDAPCTATGTCRRHPDVLHRITRTQIGEMAELQRELLDRAAGWLAPGGRLVYAVCSLEREEGEAVAAALDLASDPIRTDELPAGLAPTPEGWLRTDPGMLAEAGGLDGFFVARWRAG
ncbi:RsmB/NOP family class I SAM-dependent RNA methyltransferase [Novosphingobium flavum]|uniref:RsmB/NOP family class I SAM-dependent RNA methyltransferase n=1 Tax=Novosphingobium aerophilum TaxID=2839843 RepID=A0A7X1F8J2_9SPHN|nr:RsmB/NOP family class I SAM-dependent RNA methyltransferase [Novosphingobium aerophilum]MBC2652348.1 RsmB/NOP family class I SAM-dependent RNA methyltransferase [Novosphingobium aerophilum]MBC2663014.1 RsmB/NOP family class I SAM-dependent RNA methyltransferase [Novosphingobium aerophilum]